MVIFWLVLAAISLGLGLSGNSPGYSFMQAVGSLVFAASYYFFPK